MSDKKEEQKPVQPEIVPTTGKLYENSYPKTDKPTLEKKDK